MRSCNCLSPGFGRVLDDKGWWRPQNDWWREGHDGIFDVPPKGRLRHYSHLLCTSSCSMPMWREEMRAPSCWMSEGMLCLCMDGPNGTFVVLVFPLGVFFSPALLVFVSRWSIYPTSGGNEDGWINISDLWGLQLCARILVDILLLKADRSSLII